MQQEGSESISPTNSPAPLPSLQPPALAPDPVSLPDYGKPLLRWGAIVLALAVISYFFIDDPLARFLYGPDDFWHRLAVRSSGLGKAKWYVIAMIPMLVLAMLLRWRMWASRLGLAIAGVAISGIVIQLPKWSVGRYRPETFFEKGLSGFKFFSTKFESNSFPSGHACTIASMCTVLWLVWPRWGPVWVLLAAYVSATRLLASVHYLSDTMCGAYLGAATVLLLYRPWVQRFGPIRRPQIG